MRFNFNNPVFWICGALLLLLAIYSLVEYFIRGAAFKKGEHGKQFVHDTLKRYASPRKMTVLSDVSLSDGETTVKFDHVMIGYFGVLFVQSIQGGGSFWGDGKEEIWAFTDNEDKVLFKNPITELEEKTKVFRRVLGQNKIYKVPAESAVVIVTMGKEPKLYLSNIAESGCSILTQEMFKAHLDEHFEKDNGVDVEVLTALFQK